MKQSGHLNPREETGTVCPVTSRYGRTPQNKHGGVGRQQQLNHYSANNYDNHTHNGQYTQQYDRYGSQNENRRNSGVDSIVHQIGPKIWMRLTNLLIV